MEELQQLAPEQDSPDVLARLKLFLTDISVAWAEASQEHRNRLARELFEIVWAKNERVIAVRPRPELRPFFQISEDCQARSRSGDPDRIRTGDLCLDRAVC